MQIAPKDFFNEIHHNLAFVVMRTGATRPSAPDSFFMLGVTRDVERDLIRPFHVLVVSFALCVQSCYNAERPGEMVTTFGYESFKLNDV